MEKTINNKSKTKSEILKTLTINKKHKVTIEKVLTGEYVDKYVVKSRIKRCILKDKATTIAAFKTNTNRNGKIVSADYPVFNDLSQCERYLEHVKKSFKFKKSKGIIK